MYNDLVFSTDQRHFWKYLIIIGAYYALPSLQFVIFQEETDNNDLCYFNMKCQHSLGRVISFNNVISNIFYCFFGLLFISIVKVHSRTREVHQIDMDPSIYYALGIAIFFEGIFSGIYHVCPSKLNFQFDTTFMLFGIALSFLALYQKRHPNNVPSAFKTYIFLSIVVLLNLFPLLESTRGLEIWSWIMFYMLTVYVLISGCLQIYFGEQLSDSSVSDTKNVWRQMLYIWRSSETSWSKLILVGCINVATISLIIVAQVEHHIFFTMWVLCLFICNLIIYYIYYLVQKIRHNEWISLKKWVGLVISLTILSLAILVFEIPVTNKSLTHKESNELNKPCILFNFWDYHDLWHILSAIGLFGILTNIYFLDTDTYARYTTDYNYPIF
jgi:hypothetical protein